jgi:hypothetical protein
MDIIEPAFSDLVLRGDVIVNLGQPVTPTFAGNEGLERSVANFPFYVEKVAEIP